MLDELERLAREASRESFETEMRLNGYEGDDFGRDEQGNYLHSYMRGNWWLYRTAWAAARAEAIEEAAREAESFCTREKAVNLTARELHTNDVADDIASAIRALKELG